MPTSELYLGLFALRSTARPIERLEDRMKRFLESEPTSESLDDDAFAHSNGSNPKADYLLGQRRFVAELKTINADPSKPVQQRLKARLARPGSPVVFGTIGLMRFLDALHDRDELLKMTNDIPGRAVRRHLQKSNDQIEATKIRLNLHDAAGLAIIMNDSEPMIDAPKIGYAIRSALEMTEGGCSHVTYVWANIESHRIKLPDGTRGFPQLIASRSMNNLADISFISTMLEAWATFNQSELQGVMHNGDWSYMKPIFDGPPPVLDLS